MDSEEQEQEEALWLSVEETSGDMGSGWLPEESSSPSSLSSESWDDLLTLGPSSNELSSSSAAPAADTPWLEALPTVAGTLGPAAGVGAQLARPYPEVGGAMGAFQDLHPPMIAAPPGPASGVGAQLARPYSVGPPGPPPWPLPAGPQPKRQRSGASAIAPPFYRYDEGELDADTVIDKLCREWEHQCIRPDWMLSDGSKYEGMCGRVYIEHGPENRVSKTRRDDWKKTTYGAEKTGEHYFKEDAAGRYILCERDDAGRRGTVAWKKDVITIRVRSPEAPYADADLGGGRKLKADLWNVLFRYQAADQESKEVVWRLFHILPSHITRRGQGTAPKVKHESKREAKRRAKPRDATAKANASLTAATVTSGHKMSREMVPHSTTAVDGAALPAEGPPPPVGRGGGGGEPFWPQDRWPGHCVSGAGRQTLDAVRRL